MEDPDRPFLPLSLVAGCGQGHWGSKAAAAEGLRGLQGLADGRLELEVRRRQLGWELETGV